MSENLAERRSQDKLLEFHCDRHNVDYRGVIESCHLCDGERQQKQKEWQAKKEKECLEEKKKKYLANINIPDRFRNANLENYIIKNDKQKQVVNDIRSFLENTYNTGLLMIGKTGTGKTHLYYAIMKKFIEDSVLCPKMIKCSELIRLFKDNWQTKEATEQSIIDNFSNKDLLIINELGIQFGSEMEKQYLTEIIDNRYERMFPTILVGNVTMQEMITLLGDRIIDRFRQDGKVLVFDWESYRKKS